MWRLIINDPKGIWIFFFHSPNSMSWSSVRMRMMLGRMLRLSRWNRGFSLWLDRKMEAWATANTASSTKSRAAGPCVAMATNYERNHCPSQGSRSHTTLISPRDTCRENKTQKWGREVQLQQILAWILFQVLNLVVVTACGFTREIVFMLSFNDLDWYSHKLGLYIKHAASLVLKILHEM